MEYSINIYSALLKEIASLSFDPYPLSHEDLSEITRIRTLLTSSLPSKPDEIISSLCMESEKKLRFEYEAALSAQQKRTESGMITDSSDREVSAKKAMLQNATKSYYLADTSKLGKRFAFNVCSLDKIAGIIDET